MRVVESYIRDFGVIAKARVRWEGRGLVLIDGVNRDSTDGGSNGSGKTSLIPDAIAWALFGRTTKGLVGDRVVRRGSERGALVRVDFYSASQPGLYRVARYRMDSAEGSTVRIFHAGRELTRSTVKDSDALLRGVIGATFETWMYTTILGQGLSYRFSALRDEQRIRLLEGITQLPEFDRARSLVSEESRGLRGRCATLAGVCQEISQRYSETQAELLEMETRLARLPAGPAVGGLEVVRASRRRAEERVAREQESLDSIRTQAMEKGSAVREVESSLVKTQNKIVEIERRHTDAGRIRLVAESERRCVTCHQPLPPAVLDEVVAEATEVRGQTEKSLAEKRRRERALQSRLVECRRELEQVLGVEGHQRKLLVAAKAEVHEQRAALESLETQQQAAAESLQLRGRVAATQDTLHVLQKRLAERKQELGLLETQAAYPEWWVDGFQRLRADVLRRSVEFLSQRLGYYCGCLSGGTIQAEVKLDEKAISRGVGISISLRVSVLGSTYEEASGGERDRVDLAMAFALHDLAQRTSGFSANFLVCDEVGGFIDVQGVERMVSLLREKAQTLDAVFVISHNPAWKHHIDTVIRLERKDGASRVIPSKA